MTVKLKDITGLLGIEVPVTVVDIDAGIRKTINAGKAFDWDIFNRDAEVESIDMSEENDREFDELVLIVRGLLD